MAEQKRIFISYSSEDVALATSLRESLSSVFGDLDFFLAQNSIAGSQKWRDSIKFALGSAELLVAIITSRSIKSQWVMAEIGSFWATDRSVLPLLENHELQRMCPEFISMHQARFLSVEGFFEQVSEDIAAHMSAPLKSKRAIRFDQLESDIRSAARQQMGPGDVVIAWNQFLRDRDIAAARVYTAKRSEDYVFRRFGGLEGLSEKYRSGPDGVVIVLDVSVSGNYASVSYLTHYQDERKAVRQWRDLLTFEDGVWKVIPEMVCDMDLTPNWRNGG